MQTFIHIGYPKTASTWFQEEFFPKVMNFSYLKREQIKKYIISPNCFQFNKNNVSENLCSANHEKILISEEMLLGNIPTSGFNLIYTKENADRIKKVFPDANIVIFVRNQADIIASAYSHYIRYSGGTYSINKFLWKSEKYTFHDRLALFSFDFLQYHLVIEYYMKLFGKHNVDVYLFEEFKENSNSFIKEFVNKYKFDIDLESINFKPKLQNYNFLLLKTIKFLNIFTKYNTINKYYIIHFPKWHGFIMAIFKFLDSLFFFKRKPRSLKVLGNENYNFIQEYYKESNKILKEKYNLPVEDYNYSY